MEPRREEPHRERPKAPTSRPEEKRKRFRIVKLEERIAPGRKSTMGGGCSGVCGTLSIE
jgi:hypothetical protein